MFGLLESGARLRRAEDEVVVAGEKPRHTEEAAFPVEMVVRQECADGGAERHAFWISVRTDGSCLVSIGRSKNVQMVAVLDRVLPEPLSGGFMVTVSLPPTVPKPQYLDALSGVQND